MNGTPHQIAEALKRLGISSQDIRSIREAPTLDEAVTRLRLIKATTRRHYRTAVRELHPDRTNNDPNTTAIFRLVTELHDRLQDAQVSRVVNEFFSVPVGPWNVVVTDEHIEWSK